MECSSRSIRRAALRKIAALSSSTAPTSGNTKDVEKLSALCSSRGPQSNGFLEGVLNASFSKAHPPMTLRELDVLLALCHAAATVPEIEAAEKLLGKISPYLSQCHEQAFLGSAFFHDIEPSPWETMANCVTRGLLQIGTKYPNLKKQVSNQVLSFLDGAFQAASELRPAQQANGSLDGDVTATETTSIMALSVALLGFIEAAAVHADCWDAADRMMIVQRIRQIISESFLVHVETALSTIRNSGTSKRSFRDWRKYARQYSANGRPLGAMLLRFSFMRFVVAATSLLVCDGQSLRQNNVMDLLLLDYQFTEASFAGPKDDNESIEALSAMLTQEMGLLEDGADFLRLGSTWQQKLGYAVKAYVIMAYINCSAVSEDATESDVVLEWLESTISDPTQMADDILATSVLKGIAVISKLSPAFAMELSKTLSRFIVQGGAKASIIDIAASALAQVLKQLSQDTVISTLYTLGNVLSARGTGERSVNEGPLSNRSTVARNSMIPNAQRTGSAISLALSGEEDEHSAVYGNVIQAVVAVASHCHDEKISALAQTMLIQKVGKIGLAIDARIIKEVSILGVRGSPAEFRSLLKSYSKLGRDALIHQNDIILRAILQAHNKLSSSITRKSQLYETYLVHLLETIISKGDLHEDQNSHQSDVDLAAHEITYLLQPLAILISSNQPLTEELPGEDILSLFRDAWFNIIVHDINPNSTTGSPFAAELHIVAKNSHALIFEQISEEMEGDIDLNSVLRRGMTPQHTVEAKRKIISLLPNREADIKSLSYPKVMFLTATYHLEVLRAASGDITKIISYFIDPSLRSGEMGSCLTAVSQKVTNLYLGETLAGANPQFNASYTSKQLVALFTACCHRIEAVQRAAALCADRLINEVPSSLCQKSSLFALLELLSLMWTSCLEAETDEYEWKSNYTSRRGKISVELSDSYTFRRVTLDFLYKFSRKWVARVMNIAPLDVKGLLQSYLSEYDDDGAYGHIALGRSFALEMGSMIPSTDQRLAAIDRQGDANINTASDFIAQYTTRQEYRHSDPTPDHGNDWLEFMRLDRTEPEGTKNGRLEVDDIKSVLVNLEARTVTKKFVSNSELRDVLRRAAALLCRSKEDRCAIVHQLVGIPFTIFTKHSIKLGISLWLGVINENPMMEPRVLVEIAENWERSVRQKVGIFDDRIRHVDPFFVKGEFAPSDKQALSYQQQNVQSLISPHLRILQFLNSHFNANRLGSRNLQQIFQRLVRVTLGGLDYCISHPLVREVYFQIVLFGFRVLQFSKRLDSQQQSNLSDRLLSAGLHWFASPPMWSFGGNRLQVKAEIHLISDVEASIRSCASIIPKVAFIQRSLQAKRDLLLLLLSSEKTRLLIWLFPLSHDLRRHFFHHDGGDVPGESELQARLKVAWSEDPKIAIHFASRFESPKLGSYLRWLLLNFPIKAIDEPDALQHLIGPTLPNDLSFQLKYLLYWAPVNPITAVAYFQPTYGNNPLLLQYAMRALESHSVDVTFFFVPQIVQTLRYDVFGYVERYIIETAKFSQLFAHQIIWNMKANAYKDEDSQEPDSIKPILDKVMARLVGSFSPADKLFYDREFSFFNEVTEISGKLKPFIKASKPEKKQKIEEELRKIKVEIGVYLPSNPDGVVIGIDRKSGKPLQSHAKAPYMATFRIQKNVGGMEGTESLLSQANQISSTQNQNTIDVWQSAIFKVGDDCRQDVLALQMIAAFRGIFNNIGLDVFVYPYRVTATAPGCGVIDVLPNSISRDMLGREAVNGLYDYFVSKYGGEDSIKFQVARNNFVKSMAAYSVISYLLQFKDRHNGNIMIDDKGHILHIDFGFCFDIAPGGVRFERAPFKLTGEMIAVMGGSVESQSYHWFEELCVKAFLASRQYCEKLANLVILMLDSGLPCFKPETIQHFKDRFVLGKNEREAAEFMRMLVKKSQGSYSTSGYDRFQLLTNGIPY
ncbi:MAG: phosphatidylinositol-4- kinase [Vezdaea aestivalis]|nr:MAG: phosphatidylinositol-4- kinase [Vezdaea aestivalis]